MRILLTNDDGIHARGLKQLAKTLCASTEHEIFVVAPSDEKSGVGHGFTLYTPLFVNDVDFYDCAACYVTGTPVDCVKLACHNLLDSPPDIIVSGINKGANLGSDVLYSGTASAALEGAMFGIPSIAISSNASDPKFYDTAAQFAIKAVAYLSENKIPKNTMLNINAPDMPQHLIKGVRIAQLSNRVYNNSYIEREDPRGRRYFWLPNDTAVLNNGDCDEDWVEQGYISVTPVSSEVTNQAFLEIMKQQNYFDGKK